MPRHGFPGDLIVATRFLMSIFPDQLSSVPSLNVVILAAGDSTRMRSDTPKVLHPLGGRPLIEYSVRLADALSTTPPVVVIGRGAEAVRSQLGTRARYVEQQQRLGTGHAVMQARGLLAGQEGTVAVFYADMPLLTVDTMGRLLDLHAGGSGVLSMLTFESATPRGFGRIVRTPDGEVQAIVEEVDCTPEQRLISELNPGLYCFDADWIWENIDSIPVSPKGEYYLTDLVGIAVSQGRKVAAVKVDDATEMLGINTREHLAEAEAVLRGRVNRRHMQAGVTLIDPQTTYIDDTVSIDRDTVVFPATHLRGMTRIGQGCRIGPDTTVENTSLGSGCRVTYSVLEGAVVEDGVEIGPFAHLRSGAHLASGVHMGNFGEVKNSYLGPGVKMGHFSYIGDAQIGSEANIGAGTITCNYDGSQKHPTEIGAGAFIGSDTMLVAPVRIGMGARTGAGSVVTRDVPDGETAVGVPARLRGLAHSDIE